MKKKRIISVILAALMLLSILPGCMTGNGGTSDSLNDGSNSEISPGSLVLPDIEFAPEDMFSNRDKETGYTDYVEIKLSDNNISSNSENVSIDGNTVTISSAGTYALSGSLSNGQIIVNAGKEDKIQLVLQGIDINCDTSAAIYVKQADKVFITLDNATTNTFSNKKDFVSIDKNSIDSVIFSKEDLTFNGSGFLIINAAYGHGIVSKDDLVITSGNYKITSAGHGIEGKDSVRIADGDFAIISDKDGIHADNTDDATLGFIYISGGSFNITAGTDGFDASASLQIDDGTFNITTGGSSKNSSTNEQDAERPGWGRWGQETTSGSDTASAKGLKADGDILLKAGTFTIDSSDDALHSNSNVYIKSGTIDISSGDDGIHADKKVAINGGTITISKSYEGIEGQNIDITGGIISIIASDDGLNAAGGNDGSGLGNRPGMDGFNADVDRYIKISGGKLTINASGDGIDSNGNLYVTGGETYVSGPTNNGDGALDYEGTAQITGGILIAVGSSGMAQNFGTSSTQGSILLNLSSSQNGGSAVTLKDESGNVIVSYAPEKSYASVVVSAPAIKQGSTYTLTTGASSQSITMQNLIYSSGTGMGSVPGGQKGGMGGVPGGRR